MPTRCAIIVVSLGLFVGLPSAADQWDPASTHAVIVGVLEWPGGLTPYSKKNRKDQELRDVLVQRGTPPQNIHLLLDEDATLPKIREALATVLKAAGKDSTLIVYYAGHGWAWDGDYYFANYEVDPRKKDSAWRLGELGATVASDFKGARAFFWADCCYSGGLEVVVDKLAPREIGAFCLTSASTANSSTSNWTFTQSIIDGLRGEPLVDRNDDGAVTLGELHAEVRDAMRHLEGQQHGFKAEGLPDNFKLAETRGSRPVARGTALPLGAYVSTDNRWGRIVGGDAAAYSVQFYEYSEKTVKRIESMGVTASTRAVAAGERDAGVKADCEVEWRGRWFRAKILKSEKDRWKIHYIGFDDSWDEWVTKERIRFLKAAG